MKSLVNTSKEERSQSQPGCFLIKGQFLTEELFHRHEVMVLNVLCVCSLSRLYDVQCTATHGVLGATAHCTVIPTEPIAQIPTPICTLYSYS
jgi:hypothetical protein